jgi:membrane-associated phospholipid phosphatase
VPAILQWGLDLIQAIVAIRSPILNTIMEGFTTLGNEETYLLLIPLLLWSVELGLAVRLGVAFLVSSYVNTLLKDLVMEPRPCDLAPVCISEAEGYGLPSGHAQSAALVWGLLGYRFKRGWVWVGAILLTLLIGFSRVYLGVHFPTDVLAGWALGLGFLGAYILWGARVEQAIRGLGLTAQIVLAVLLALLLFFLHPVKDVAAATAALAGVGVGLALMARFVPFSVAGPPGQRALRFLVGVVFVVALFYGLRVIFPAEGEPLYLLFRMLRYALVGLWISLGAPWLFLKLGLAAPGSGLAQQG